MRYRTVIIGLGQIGMGYDLQLDRKKYIYSHARSFQTHPDFDLVAAVDTVQENRELFTKEYGVPSYLTYADAVKGVKPDLVAIAVPTILHSSVIAEVLNVAPPKAILCEKPLAYSVADGLQIVDLCAKKNVCLYVNYMRRSEQASVEVKRRIQNNEIRGPLKGCVWYSKGLIHNGSHFFNLLEYWLGKMQNFQIISFGRLLSNSDAEPDFQVSFENGSVVFLAGKEENFSCYSIELLAQNGRLRYEEGGRSIEWRPAIKDNQLQNYTFLSKQPEMILNDFDRYQYQVVHQLARALAKQPASICTGIDALETLRNIQTILRGVQ